MRESFDEVVASSSSSSAEKHDVFVPGRLCLLGEHSDWVRRRIKQRRRKRFEADFFFLSFDSLFSIGCKMTSRVGRRITNNVFVSFSTRLIIHTKKGGRISPGASIVTRRRVSRRRHQRRDICHGVCVAREHDDSHSNKDIFRRDEGFGVGSETRRCRTGFIARRERGEILVLHRRDDQGGV